MSYIVKPPCDEAVISAAPAPDLIELKSTTELKNATQSELSTTKNQIGLWVLAATILGSSMAFIDGTVVNVALPVLQTDLQATVANVQWVIKSYSLFLASLVLVGGSLGDALGGKTTSTLWPLCALRRCLYLVWSVPQHPLQLIIARAVQEGSVLLFGARRSLAIISASFSERYRRGRAVGTWSSFTSITSAIGPVLGGWLVQHTSWRWVFFLNVPLAAIVVILLFWRVPESRSDCGKRIPDWTGGEPSWSRLAWALLFTD